MDQQQRHNSDLSVISLGTQLAGKKIALGITGGIAAVETPKLVRQLRRFGSTVEVFMTPAATRFITPLSLGWASTQPVITDLTQTAPHICSHDAVVVAPATLNALSKTAQGMADNVVLTLLASALGQKIPIVMVPTMVFFTFNVFKSHGNKPVFFGHILGN